MELDSIQCTKCKKWKSITEFPVDKRSKKTIRRKRCVQCAETSYVEPSIAKIKRFNNPEGYLLAAARQRAKRKNLEFNIDIQDIFIPTRCPLLGVVLEMSGDPSLYNSPSLDRIDPLKGYIKGNVWVISKRANSIKTNASLDEIEKVAVGLKRRLGCNAENSDFSNISNVVYMKKHDLIEIASRLDLQKGATLIDLLHCFKLLRDSHDLYEYKCLEVQKGISGCLSIAESARYPSTNTSINNKQDYFLRIRADGLIIDGEKEVVCNPGRARYDSFKVTDTGVPINEEQGLAIVMANLRKEIQKLLRAHGVTKAKELNKDGNA